MEEGIYNRLMWLKDNDFRYIDSRDLWRSKYVQVSQTVIEDISPLKWRLLKLMITISHFFKI